MNAIDDVFGMSARSGSSPVDDISDAVQRLNTSDSISIVFTNRDSDLNMPGREGAGRC